MTSVDTFLQVARQEIGFICIFEIVWDQLYWTGS